MSLWLLLPIMIGTSFFITGALRRYALTGRLMDIPNSRSSHSTPMPRGGGVAIVLTFLSVLPFLALNHMLSWSLMLALLGSGSAVAIIGFLDDHSHIPVSWRLLGHFGAAIWALFWLGGLPPFNLFGMYFDLGWVGYTLAVVYLVWLLNLYNFMDGIDGIASVEAICVCMGGMLLYTTLDFPGSQQAMAWIMPMLLTAAVAGFLFWNFPPARIFMGDAGSGFLGITLGILSLQAAWVAPQFLWCWLILLGVFIIDASWTLIRRFLRGKKVYEAHRSHAYQYASRHFGRHLPVTLGVVGINLFWLLPIALWVALGKIDGLTGLLIAYFPLVMLAVKFKAGKAE
ncbi:MraY family glycosyltransferase [Microbulbifer sp. 2201CG32-9]|uniref:MraY family glycosyltransferase n=1 Tax=Microbulbifer sp. 2201CG32-9 TaxID=3232309 RepID=UPI00345C581F